jgi:dephospho-CoA kinase
MRIGIAGYMGAGKTTCARSFESGGARVIDADAEAKALMARDCLVRDGLRAAFGDSVAGEDGVRTGVLGRAAFQSAESLRALNRVTHPPLVALLETLVLGCAEPLCILDAALIPLWNIEPWFDLCVWFDAPFEMRLARVRAKRADIDERELVRRMRLQEEVMDVPADGGRWVRLPDSECRGYIVDFLKTKSKVKIK